MIKGCTNGELNIFAKCFAKYLDTHVHFTLCTYVYTIEI